MGWIGLIDEQENPMVLEETGVEVICRCDGSMVVYRETGSIDDHVYHTTIPLVFFDRGSDALRWINYEQRARVPQTGES